MSQKIKRLLKSLTDDERRLLATEFVAPAVCGARVRTRVRGLVYTFDAIPRDFEGWGIFSPLSEKEAELIEEASLALTLEYLKLFKPLRVRLAYGLEGQTWLAYPANESDARQRVGAARPLALHLVTDGAQFEPAIARFDGASFWFEDIDRRADPRLAELLREALKDEATAEQLRFKGLTPEMRTVYELAFERTAKFRRKLHRRRDEARLKDALDMAGGSLQAFRDRGSYWTVEWTTRDGERHASAISKSDLTVLSSGICLSGRDRDFDLASLVGVMERRDEWD